MPMLPPTSANAANPGGVIEVPGELTQRAGTGHRPVIWNMHSTHGPYRAGEIGILSRWRSI
jgi:hypothetical protein